MKKDFDIMNILQKIVNILVYPALLSITFWLGFFIYAVRKLWYDYHDENNDKYTKTFIKIGIVLVIISILYIPMSYIVSVNSNDTSHHTVETYDKIAEYAQEFYKTDTTKEALDFLAEDLKQQLNQ